MLVTPLHRRSLLAVLCGGAVLGAGCSRNEATGRRQLAFLSDSQLAALSQSAWADLKRTLPRADDPALAETLERVGRGIADASGRTDETWEFVVFDSPEINAFVLPGGKVGFFRGLMEFAGSEGEIAAVMGHEVGHVEARHAAERMSQQLVVQIGVQLAAAALQEEYGRNASAIAGALGMGALYGVILPYSRKHELEADALGVRLMQSSGYDPRDALGFWRRMIEANEDRARPLEWLSTASRGPRSGDRRAGPRLTPLPLRPRPPLRS